MIEYTITVLDRDGNKVVDRWLVKSGNVELAILKMIPIVGIRPGSMVIVEDTGIPYENSPEESRYSIGLDMDGGGYYLKRVIARRSSAPVGTFQ